MNTQPVPTETVTSEPTSYAFSPREFARLDVYRAAIAAGFYTDRLPRQSRTSAIDADLSFLLGNAA